MIFIFEVMNDSYLINQLYIGTDDFKGLYDLYTAQEINNKDLVVFTHGYMGYKDWGAWNLVGDFFVQNNLSFCKFNFTHNGTSLEDPTHFVDLERFARDSYYREKTELRNFIDQVCSAHGYTNVHLIGHSRGGGIVALQSNHLKVKSITTWCGICSIEERMPEGQALENWKKEQVYYRENGRTKQQMPHSYFQYQDFIEHKSELDIKASVIGAKIPFLHIHGENDTSVPITEGERLAAWSNTELVRIKNCNHTFETCEPWTENTLSSQLFEACETTLNFIKRQLNG